MQGSARQAVNGGGIQNMDMSATNSALDERLAELLTQRRKLRESDLKRLTRLRSNGEDGGSLSHMVNKLGMVAELDLAQALAELMELPLAAPADYPDALFEQPLPRRFMQEHHVVPLQADDERLCVALAEPDNAYLRHALELASDGRLEAWVGTPSDIEHALQRLFGEGDEREGVDEVDVNSAPDEADIEQLRDLASEAPVIRLVNQIIQRAIDAAASDIHIEPFEDRLKVRYRIDGVLHDTEAPSPHLAAAVISRIKIMAQLDIAERRLPQDGRIKLRMQGMEIDVRISTVPTMHGESVVMRLLNRDRLQINMETLGFSPLAREQIEHSIAQPHGMLIVTGPTGSGKTTTLYAALQQLNTEERKILTVEDPVEYQLEGINQIQVKPSIELTFANSLRAIVRQDPDVIMVGEIRDGETARICVQSALTGHLVLSTLHTNSAAASVARLLEMGVEDYLLVSTINAVVGQRLVRVLCPACREAYKASARILRESGLKANGAKTDTTLYKAVGCAECNGTGYHGRQVIAEVLRLDEVLREKVIRHAGAAELERTARNQGMRTMYEDGLQKVLDGLTSLEEVVRVTREN